MYLRLFNNAMFATSILTPLPALVSEALHTADAAGPKSFDRGAEGECALRADDSDSLEHGLTAVPTKDGRMVDPFEAALQLVVQCRHSASAASNASPAGQEV